MSADDDEQRRSAVASLLEPGERVDAILRASGGRSRAAKAALATVWPFFREHDRFLLVATDRRWLLVESARERWRGDLHPRGTFDRAIRVDASWTTRTEAFGRPLAIDPTETAAAAAANAALDRRAD